MVRVPGVRRLQVDAEQYTQPGGEAGGVLCGVEPTAEHQLPYPRLDPLPDVMEKGLGGGVDKTLKV